MNKWVLPHREVSQKQQRILLGIAAIGGFTGYWLGGADTTLPYRVRILLALAAVGAGATVDFFRKRIPNLCSLVLVGGFVVCTVLDYILSPENALWVLISSLLGGIGLLGGLSLCRLISRGGIGIGDIKLVSASGLVLGLYSGFAALLIAQIAAVVAALLLLATKRAGWKDSMPFGPLFWLGVLGCLLL